MNTQFGGIDFDLLKYDIDLYGFKTNRFRIIELEVIQVIILVFYFI